MCACGSGQTSGNHRSLLRGREFDDGGGGDGGGGGKSRKRLFRQFEEKVRAEEEPALGTSQYTRCFTPSRGLGVTTQVVGMRDVNRPSAAHEAS